MQDANIRGFAADHTSLEVSIDGNPSAHAFTSVDPKVDREFEKMWLNGDVAPSQRSNGTIDPSFDFEMPLKEFTLLTEELGGQGDDPNAPDWQFTEFEVVLNFRPKNDDNIYQIAYHDCVIKNWSLSSAKGKAAMVKGTVDCMGVEGPVRFS